MGKSLNVSQTSPGRQPGPTSFSIEDFSNGVGRAGAQSDPLPDFNALLDLFDTFNNSENFPALSPTEGLFAETWNQFDISVIGQSLPALSPIEPPLAEILPHDQARPQCAKFFIMLQHAIWGPTASRPVDPPHPVVQACYTIMMIEGISLTRQLVVGLQRRVTLVEVSRDHEVKIQQEIAKGMSRDKAVKVVMTRAIANVSKELAEVDERRSFNMDVMERLSPVEHVMLFTRIFREGERWRELVDAVGALEILLIDANHPDCLREFSSLEDYCEIGQTVNLECCPTKGPSLGVQRIMNQGTDEVFAKLKKTLLAPELQLELTCQRLSGLFTLIYRLFQKDEPDLITRWFSQNMHDLTRGPFKDQLPDLDSFLISEIPRRIKNAFGSDPFPLHPDWSDDQSTSDDDDDDDDSSLRNGVFGNNEGQNDGDFGEDFCIHFASTNPFASL